MAADRIKEHRAEQTRLYKEMRTLNTAPKPGEEMSKESAEKFDELSKKYDAEAAAITREERMLEIDRLSENRTKPPIADTDGGSGLPGGDDSAESEQRTASDADVEKRFASILNTFYREGSEAITPEQRSELREMTKKVGGDKEMRAATLKGNGVVGTRYAGSVLTKAMEAFDGMKEAGAKIITTSTGNVMTQPTTTEIVKGEIVGEAQPTTEKGIVYGNASWECFKFSSKKIPVSLEMLEDAEFDVEGHIMEEASERIGRRLNEATSVGSGSGEPWGAATRAAHVETMTVRKLEYDHLLDLEDLINSAYWKDPSFGYMFNQKTVTDARKLKDANGNPLWTQAFGGQPDRINNRPYVLNPEMRAFDSNDLSEAVALAGCFNKYTRRDVTRPYIIRDHLTDAESAMINFIVFSRHGGNTAAPHAFAVLRSKATA